MSYELKGTICQIGQTQQVSDKFKKREFVVETKEDINGNIYTNYAKFQLVQAKCDLMNERKAGDEVKVSFNIKGNKWERDGKAQYMTNLDAWRIEKVTDIHQQGTPAATNYTPSPNSVDDGLPF